MFFYLSLNTLFCMFAVIKIYSTHHIIYIYIFFFSFHVVSTIFKSEIVKGNTWPLNHSSSTLPAPTTPLMRQSGNYLSHTDDWHSGIVFKVIAACNDAGTSRPARRPLTLSLWETQHSSWLIDRVVSNVELKDFCFSISKIYLLLSTLLCILNGCFL